MQQTFHGDRFTFDIDANTHRALADLTRANGVTMFMALHGALAVLMSKLSGADEVTIGTPIAGRGQAALDHLVGMFVNTLVLRTSVDPDITFADLLEHVREIDLAAFQNSDLPFERLVDVINPTRSTSYSPLFQVALELQNNEPAHFHLPGLDIDGLTVETKFAKEDLELIVDEKFDEFGIPAGMSAAFDFATDLFEPATIRRFADRLRLILDAVGRDPATRIADIGILGADETAAPGAGIRCRRDSSAGVAGDPRRSSRLEPGCPSPLESREVDDLPRARRGIDEAGARAVSARRRSRRFCGAGSAAVHCGDRRDLGGHENRCSVLAGRPELSRRSHQPHARRFAGRTRHHRRRSPQSTSRHGRVDGPR